MVIEEKIDGANAGVSFSSSGELRLQSRGHFLTGGPRERHFERFKAWAFAHRDALWDRLGSRRILYGEWVYAKHTIFYDRLPHYFLEFDLYDRDEDAFWSTDRRRDGLAESPVVSVPVLFTGQVERVQQLHDLIRPSCYRSSNWKTALRESAVKSGVDVDRVFAETDRAEESEGLYLKVEEDGVVQGRYKFVRPSFLTQVVDSGSHWLQRPIVENRLAEGVDIMKLRP